MAGLDHVCGASAAPQQPLRNAQPWRGSRTVMGVTQKPVSEVTPGRGSRVGGAPSHIPTVSFSTQRQHSPEGITGQAQQELLALPRPGRCVQRWVWKRILLHTPGLEGSALRLDVRRDFPRRRHRQHGAGVPAEV